MQYKKKIFYFIMTLLCVFLLASVNLLAALPDGNSEITEIPNLEGEETSFGKLTKISDEESS